LGILFWFIIMCLYIHISLTYFFTFAPPFVNNYVAINIHISIIILLLLLLVIIIVINVIILTLWLSSFPFCICLWTYSFPLILIIIIARLIRVLLSIILDLNRQSLTTLLVQPAKCIRKRRACIDIFFKAYMFEMQHPT